MTNTAFCSYCFSNQPAVEHTEGGQRKFRCTTCGSPVEVAHPVRETVAVPPPKILCIDDDRLLLGLFSEALAAHGFQALTATNGPSGIETARKERPDLIFVDVMMPRMSGFEVCRQLRTDAKLRETPIILLTAAEDPNLEPKGKQVGATLSLHKPFGPGELLTTIRQILASKIDLPVF